jgi:DDE superfamily endonuclease
MPKGNTDMTPCEPVACRSSTLSSHLTNGLNIRPPICRTQSDRHGFRPRRRRYRGIFRVKQRVRSLPQRPSRSFTLIAGSDEVTSAQIGRSMSIRETRSRNPRLRGKALYVRVGSNRLYDNARAFRLPEFFYTQVGFTTNDFDTILGIVAAEIAKPLNSRLLRTRVQNDAIISRKRAFAPAEMLFLYLQVMRGANEGGQGLETISFSHGISIGTCSTYLHHTAHAVYYALKQCSDARIQWTPSEDRKAMSGLIVGFPNVISFVDGTKVRTWRPSDPERQEAQYCGHHHFHCHVILVWTDIYGLITRLDFAEDGSRHDRGIYNDSAPLRHPAAFFSDDEHAIADTGFQGKESTTITPFKKGQGRYFDYRTQFNRDIRKQRITNEHVIGIINNRNRLLLGRWPYERRLFRIKYEVAAMLTNWRWRTHGQALVPLEARMQNVVDENAGNW